MKVSLLFGAALLGVTALVAAARGQGDRPAQQPESQPAEAQPGTQEKTVYVLMKTSMGDITLELNREKAPISTDNFLAYTDKKFYDGTVFHRVIKDFMIQGGGFTPDLTQKSTDKPIKNEWQNGLKNKRGTIAMARLGGRADSATSQFFINLKDNDFLDMPRDGSGYAVFGRVVEGMDVVDKIGTVRTGPKNTPQGMPMQDVPAESVTITEMRRMTPDEVQSLKSRIEKK